MIGEGKRNWSL